MIKCVSHKKVYLTELVAEDALIHARGRLEAGGPVAVYRCEDCGYYHLTSKGPMSEKLAKQIGDGTLARQREANHWLDKLNRKK